MPVKGVAVLHSNGTTVSSKETVVCHNATHLVEVNEWLRLDDYEFIEGLPENMCTNCAFYRSVCNSIDRAYQGYAH